MSKEISKVICCRPMISAQSSGTDNAGAGALIYVIESDVWMGTGLDPIHCCPWCKKKIETATTK